MADSRTRRRTTRLQKRAYDAFTLSEFTSQLDELGISELANFFAVTICGQFAVPQVQIFLRDAAVLTLTACKGIEGCEPQTLKISKPVHDELANNKSVRRFEKAKTHPALAQLAGAFTDWKPSLMFPMVHKSSLVGLCAVGRRMDGRPLGDYQINLLSAMVSHVSLAIGNSRVLEKVRETTQIIKEMDREKQAMRDQREDFVRLACHELNTPLTVINLSLNMLLDDEGANLSDYQKNLVEQIRENSARLAEIHRDLITFAKRNVTPRHDATVTSVLKEVVDRALEKSQPLFAERPDIELQVALSDDLPAVAADGESLARALVNILQNAIKYTPETGGKIRLEASRKDDSVICNVTDNGIGIESKYIENVFEPFFEVIDTRKRSSSKTRFLGAGLGLGLTIARDIVEKHGGKIRLKSKGKNKGTTVSLMIPAAPEGINRNSH